MADKVGAEFAARISGVTRFGLFVTVLDSGANGLIPLSSLPDDFWVHDDAAQALHGRRTRMTYSLAQPITVRLVEASPITGGLLFAAVDPAGAPAGDARSVSKPPSGGKLKRSGSRMGANSRRR